MSLKFNLKYSLPGVTGEIVFLKPVWKSTEQLKVSCEGNRDGDG